MSQPMRNAFLFSLFGGLTFAAGIAAGGPALPLLAVVALMLIVVAGMEKRGWLLGNPAEPSPICLSGAAAFFLLTIASVLYARLTGGETSPLRAVLYLPIILGVLAFGVRFGLAVGVALALAFLGGALQDSLDASLSLRQAVLVALTFPLTALLAGLLARNLETRFQAQQARTDELSVMLDMSQMINSAYDLSMTMDLILLNIQTLSGCQVSAVYLKDHSGEVLERRCESVTPGRASPLALLPLEAARHGDWSVTGEWRAGDMAVPFYLSDVSCSVAPAAASLLAIDPTARAAACFPLACLEGLLGMVYVGFDQTDALTHEQIDGLAQIVSRAASPLQRLLQQQDIESLANTDVTTGLDNRRRFQQALAEETARAGRYKRALSLLILDIDHFKTVNDTYGHPAGDALLAQLAVILGNALRTVDRPARYGGEEFVILCPETGAEEARLIAERVRRTVEETGFTLPEVEKPVRVTVSVGVATYPGDALTGPELLKQADAALYDAKDSGRNAVRGPGEREVSEEKDTRIGEKRRVATRPRKLSKRLMRAK